MKKKRAKSNGLKWNLLWVFGLTVTKIVWAKFPGIKSDKPRKRTPSRFRAVDLESWFHLTSWKLWTNTPLGDNQCLPVHKTLTSYEVGIVIPILFSFLAIEYAWMIGWNDNKGKKEKSNDFYERSQIFFCQNRSKFAALYNFPYIIRFCISTLILPIDFSTFDTISASFSDFWTRSVKFNNWHYVGKKRWVSGSGPVSQFTQWIFKPDKVRVK